MSIVEIIFAIIAIVLLYEVSYNIKAINNNLISLISLLEKYTRKEEYNMASDKIYIFEDGDELWYKSEEWDTPPPHRIEYIRKDALLKLLREKRKAITECSATTERKVAALSVIDFLIEKIESL